MTSFKLTTVRLTLLRKTSCLNVRTVNSGLFIQLGQYSSKCPAFRSLDAQRTLLSRPRTRQLPRVTYFLVWFVLRCMARIMEAGSSSIRATNFGGTSTLDRVSL